MEDSNAGIDAMVADMNAATGTIHLIFYIWLEDNNGLKVVEALKRAAARGVVCRAMADGRNQVRPGVVIAVTAVCVEEVVVGVAAEVVCIVDFRRSAAAVGALAFAAPEGAGNRGRVVGIVYLSVFGIRELTEF